MDLQYISTVLQVPTVQYLSLGVSTFVQSWQNLLEGMEYMLDGFRGVLLVTIIILHPNKPDRKSVV